MEVIINDKKYLVFIEKKPIKNIYLRVKENGIYISCNRFVSDSFIKSFIYKNSDYIEKSYKKIQKKKEKEKSFYYLGKEYQVIISNTVSKIQFHNDIVFVNNIGYLDTFLKNQAKKTFNERLNVCYNLFEEDIVYPKLKIGKMKRKWGYCNNKDEIKLNTNLIRYSINEIDYVIIHELCHLIEFNHSKKFWALVKKYKKDYKEAQKILKEE